jgi:hypothetical protein
MAIIELTNSMTESETRAAQNSNNQSLNITGYKYLGRNAAFTLTSADLSAFVECSGSTPFTITLPSPVNNSGKSLRIWTNGVAVTLSTPAGNFYGEPPAAGSTSLSIPSASVVEIISDNANWIVFYSENYATPSWITISSFASGWSGQTGAIGSGIYGNWQGVKYIIIGRTVTIQGAAAKSSWSANDTVFTLPSTAWPRVPIVGDNCLIDTIGAVHISRSGTGADTFGVTYQI